MDEFILSQIRELSNSHFISFCIVKIMFVDKLQVFNEDLESKLLLSLIIMTVEFRFETNKLSFESLNLLGTHFLNVGQVKESHRD